MPSDECIESRQHKGLTIKVYYDVDCSSPRENDNLGTIIVWHRNYRLSDKDAPTHLTPDDFDPNQYAVCLPVYMYEHGGVMLSTGAFICPWDSGQVGWIYATKDKILKDNMAKRLTKKLIANTIEVFKSEVDEYGQYINGQCFGFVIENDQHEQLDSCWGFIGDYVWQAATESADNIAEQIAEKRTLRDR